MKQELIAFFLMLAVVVITTTILIFKGVYFTTLLFWVLVAQFSTYFATHYTFKLLKKSEE